MKVTAVLLLALASASAGPLLSNLKPVHPRDRTIEQSIESRIIGGHIARIGQIPYQVGMVFSNEKSVSWFCGGSIISKLWGLTAAHCTDGASSADVYAGSVLLESGVKRTVLSRNFRQHEDYDATRVLNDVSLLLFDVPLEFGSKIQSIGLPSPTDPYDSYEGQTGMVSGWGVTSDNGSHQPWFLMYAEVTVISNEKCERSYQGYIKDSHLCTDITEGKATCYGDSGGPLVYGGVQIGVVSFGSSRGCSKEPNAFSRVTYFLAWIRQHTGL